MLLLLIALSCSRDKTDGRVSLNISGGTTVLIKNNINATHRVTITSSKNVSSPITINLLSDAPKEVIFTDPILTIPQGEASISTDIIFLANEITYDSYKKITITASSPNTNVLFGDDATEFMVKQTTKDISLPKLSISANKTKINTSDEDGVVTIDFKLSESIDSDLEIGWDYGRGLSIDRESITPLPKKIVIPKGTILHQEEIRVTKGSVGNMPIIFYADNNIVDPSKMALEVVFMQDPFPDLPTTLCPLIFNFDSHAITKTFTVGNYTLSPEHNLENSYRYEDNTSKITAKVTEKSNISIQLQNAFSNEGDPYAIVAWVDWNRNGNLSENERILYSNIAAPAKGVAAPPYSIGLTIPTNTPYGKYFMRLGVYDNTSPSLKGGCGTINSGDIMDITIDYVEQESVKASITGGEADHIFVEDTDIRKEITLSLDRASDSPTTLNLAVASTGSDSPILSSSQVTIPKGEISKDIEIIFSSEMFLKSYAMSLVTVKIKSAIGAEVNKESDIISYKVNYASKEETPPPIVKLCDFSVLYTNNIFTESFTAGDYTLYPKHNANDKIYGYIDISESLGITARIKSGDKVSITYGNQDSSSGKYISAAWVDWNRDGNIDNSECIVYKEWSTSPNNFNRVLGTVETSFNAPPNATKGEYIMRIGTSLNKGLIGGCGKVGYADMFDIKVVYY